MGRWRAGFLLATLILGFASYLYYVNADQLLVPPSEALKLPVKFDHEVFDLGRVSDLTPKEVELGFSWNGETPAQLLKAVASCGCSEVELTTTRLEPGQRGSITLRFNPAGFKGPVQKSVYLYLDQGEAHTEFQAQVVPSIQAEPSLINFGKPRRGARVTRRTKIYFESEPQRLEWAMPQPGLSIVEQQLGPNTNHLTLELDTRSCEPNLDGKLYLATEEDQRLLELQVFGEVVP